MGWTDENFVEGVVAAQAYHMAELERQQTAVLKIKKLCLKRTPENEAEFQAALDAAEPYPALWQQISGITPRNEMQLEPGERRAGIRKLLRVVERMFRTEWKSADVDRDGGVVNLDDGTESISKRSVLWDPLPEVCMYLGISKAKLNALSVQRTGLRVSELCDCIRIEGIRTTLRDKFRPLMREWLERLKEKGEDSLKADFRNSAWRFLKWMRGGGRCETRKKLAFELGMTSRERLDRAALVREGETIESVEIDVAVGVIQEATLKPMEAHAATDLAFLPEGMTPQCAECDEVEESGVEKRESA